jgi:DNA polymerase-3 subunit delta
MAGRSQPRAADVLGRVTLVTGKEEFLNERTVVAVRDGRLVAVTTDGGRR